jgi:hypothetical protein
MYYKNTYICPCVLTLFGTGQGIFLLDEFVRSDFVSWFVFKKFQTFLDVKIEINPGILTQLIES